jgi:hypothetical protein
MGEGITPCMIKHGVTGDIHNIPFLYGEPGNGEYRNQKKHSQKKPQYFSNPDSFHDKTPFFGFGAQSTVDP